jgi:hypothetical protein
MHRASPFVPWISLLLCLLPADHVRSQVPDHIEQTTLEAPLGLQRSANFGASVAMENGLAVVGAPFDDRQAIDSGIVEVFAAATGTELHMLLNPDPAPGAQFGTAVAISGTRVVVGANGDSIGSSSPGRVYVYDLAGAEPTIPILTLDFPDAGLSGDYFGAAVAISGTRIVVAASRADFNAGNSGAVYVYDLDAAVPTTPVARLLNPSPGFEDRFGSSVGVSGGYVVVGASLDDTSGQNAGIAYVYDLNGVSPTVPVVTLNCPNPFFIDSFGLNVAISGTHVLVGKARDSNSGGIAYLYDLGNTKPGVPTVAFRLPFGAGLNSGPGLAIDGTRVALGVGGGAFSANATVYFYDVTSATPAEPAATLRPPAGSGVFTTPVAVSATQVLVGTPSDDTVGSDAGGAYFFDVASATPGTPLRADNTPAPSSQDHFGAAVAISGRYVVVGADRTYAGQQLSGSAAVYDLAGPTPGEPVIVLENPRPQEYDVFGSSVAISGTRVVVGTTADPMVVSAYGRPVYVYELTASAPATPAAILESPTPNLPSNEDFGAVVGISGARVVVAAPGAGRAYVFDLNGGMPGTPLTISNPMPGPLDGFATAVAISGSIVAVAAPGDSTAGPSAGSVYVYDVAGPSPATPIAILTNPVPAEGTGFGKSVAVSGSRVVVGADFVGSTVPAAGSVFVYDLAGRRPQAPVRRLENPDPTGQGFGSSVGIAGTHLIVSADHGTSTAPRSGSVYLYDLIAPDRAGLVATLQSPLPGANDHFGFAVAIDRGNAVMTAPLDDSVMPDKGIAYVVSPSRFSNWRLANPDDAVAP